MRKADITYADENRTLEESHLYELQRVSSLAANFLAMGGGDSERAISLLDETINLLLDSSVLAMWKYRLILEAIRKKVDG